MLANVFIIILDYGIYSTQCMLGLNIRLPISEFRVLFLSGETEQMHKTLLASKYVIMIEK